jgi:biopolymer transport protein ExbD
MRIRRQNESDEVAIQLTALIDVMLVMIIFFLATTAFQQEETDVAVKLPATSGAPALSSAPKVIVINVRQDGSYTLANRAMNLPELRKAVVDAVSTDRQAKVLIRGDRQALHGNVAAAVSTCKQAGIMQANIGYQYQTTQ